MRLKREVILVDDDDDLLRILKHGFESRGLTVTTFSTGNPAIAHLSDPSNLKNTALIVLDRKLPDINGLDILNSFLPKNSRNIPVLFLSSVSSHKDMIEGLKKGALDYISKPFNIEVFLEKALKLMDLAKNV